MGGLLPARAKGLAPPRVWQLLSGAGSDAPLCILPEAPRLVRGPRGPRQGQEQGGNLRQGMNGIRTRTWMGDLGRGWPGASWEGSTQQSLGTSKRRGLVLWGKPFCLEEEERWSGCAASPPGPVVVSLLPPTMRPVLASDSRASCPGLHILPQHLVEDSTLSSAEADQKDTWKPITWRCAESAAGLRGFCLALSSANPSFSPIQDFFDP